MNRMQKYNRWHVVAALAALVTAGIVPSVHAVGPGVNGRVLGLDAKGVPAGSVAGAKLEFKNRAGKVVATGTSDAKGRYKVNLAPGTYTYKIQAAGFKAENAARGLTLTLSEGYALHNFSLIRGKTDPKAKSPRTDAQAVGALKGKVQGKTAAGTMIDVPEAAISFRKAGDKKVAKVVAQGKDPKDKVVAQGKKEPGHYEATLDAGSYQVSVAAIGYKTLVVPDPQAITGGKTAMRDFVLELTKHPEPSGQGIKGAIKFADSKGPPPKARISIRSLSEAAAPATPSDPDAKGAYQHDLRSGRYQVVVEAEGFRTAASEPKEVFAGKYTVVDLRLLPAVKSASKEHFLVATVYERLPGASGRKLLPGATVLLRKVGDPLTGAPQGTSGADGKVSVKASTSGKHQLFARMNGYKPLAMQLDIGAGDNHADVELVKEVSLAALHLHVVDGKDKPARPVADAKIAISQKGKAIRSGASDAKGGFSSSLPPGTYQIDVTHAGYTPARMDVTLAAADVRRDIVLVRSIAKATLSLHIVERLKTGDKAIPGAEIVISQKDKRILAEKSGQDGKLAAPLAAGIYTVVVTKAGFKPATVQVIVAAQDVKQDIVLIGSVSTDKKVTLNLRVVERLKTLDKTLDKVIPSAENVISQKDKRILADKSGQDGKLAALLPAGSYTVIVSKTGFKPATVQVNVAAQDVKQDVVLESIPPTKKVTLNLRVVERVKTLDKTLDKAIPGAEIVISQKDKRILADKSGQDGKLAALLPAGSYTVIVSKAGFKPATVQVNLTTKELNQDIVLIGSVSPIK
jgi:Carboxypeptidase regulatory-like domain